MRKKNLAKKLCALVLSMMFIIPSNLQGGEVVVKAAGEYKEGSIITDVLTDKSMYNPGDKVRVTVSLSNGTGKDIQQGELVLQARYLNVEQGEKVRQKYSLNNGSSKELVIEWIAPDKDFTGYLLEVDAYDNGSSRLDSSAVGVDVSSSWVKFPRYGYLHEFEDLTNTSEKIAQMNRYHINGIEYYDWHYRHHEPLPSWSTKDNPGTWDDWSGRQISGQTIKNYISAAHERNMVNMAYDMIYAGTDDFFENNAVSNTWKLRHKDNGEEFFFTMGDSPSGNGNLYFVNPLHTDWQNHLFSQVNRMIDVMDFDGYHGDTVGDWGEMTDYYGYPLGIDANGNKIYSVLDTYTQFLNACKTNLPNGKYLSFNPVGAQGIQNVNISNTDVLYTEFWPWDSNRHGQLYDSYYTLLKEIEDSMKDSEQASFDGKGKSLAVKAYINYTTESGGHMNDPAVLLADAVCFAAGGSRVEIGNGDHMLHHEYYPNDTIPMSNQLKKDVEDMYNFAVAYENILRDGQHTTNNGVTLEGIETSRNGASDTVWTYTRADEEHEIIHLINLSKTDDKWRDEKRDKAVPQKKENFKVRYYNSKEVNAVYLASPDGDHCRTKSLPFTKGNDGSNYVEFVVPSLAYWDMIYMTDKTEGNLVPGTQEVFRLEAEDASLCGTGGQPAIASNTSASNGSYVNDIGFSQGYAEFTIPQEVKHGEYTLRLAYSSATNGSLSIRVNEQNYVKDYNLTSDQWIFTSGNYLELEGIELKGGDKIQIQDARDDCYIWLDYISAFLERELNDPEPPNGRTAFELEAEDGILTATEGNPVVENSDQASQGKFVHDIGASQGYVTLTVPEDIEDGYYQLALHYSSGTNGKVSIVVGDREYFCNYGNTGDWVFTADNLVYLDNVWVNHGETIRIQDAQNDCFIWLDRVVAVMQ